jgi:dihydroorotate dehydrogenase
VDVARRLRRRSHDTIVGVNVGKSKVAPLEHAAADYRQSVRILAPLADYLVLNVSSPNTPGLRELQAPERLRELIGAVRDELASIRPPIPLLVKVSPDLSDEQLDAVADLAGDLGLAGIVAVNTTVDRSVIAPSTEQVGVIDGGGVSGLPLKQRALDVLRHLYGRVGSQLILISVGGITTPGDAWERILAGATLIQAYTAFVYGGPGWPAGVNRELARCLRDAGGRSIAELVGSSAKAADEPTP